MARKKGRDSRALDRNTKKDEILPESRPWADLHQDILSLFMKRLYFVEQIQLRLVCKSWSILKGIPCIDKLPWLMTYNRYWKVCKFFDPSRKQSYTINLDLSEEIRTQYFLGAKPVASKSDWLLFVNHKKTPPLLFLYNPFHKSDGIFKLPPLTNMGSSSIVKFTPECSVFVIENTTETDQITISTWRRGDANWSTHIFSNKGCPGIVKDAEYINGAFYFVFSHGALGSFRIDHHDWIVHCNSDLVIKELYDNHCEFNMVESDGGGLLLVLLDKNSGSHWPQYNFYIQRFDFTGSGRYLKNGPSPYWINEEWLGNRTVFINEDGTSSLACAIPTVPGDKTSEMADRIYYHGIKCTQYFTNHKISYKPMAVDSSSPSCSEFYPSEFQKKIERVWIEPPRYV